MNISFYSLPNAEAFSLANIFTEIFRIKLARSLKIGFMSVVIGLSFNTFAAERIPQQEPYSMIESLATNAFERIKNERSQGDFDALKMQEIMEQELMPYVDHRFSAFKVLGKHARKVKRDELGEFVGEFKQYLIVTYATTMQSYQDQQLEFEPARDIDERTDITVKGRIIEDGKPDIKIAFKVRQQRKSGDWYVYDMVAEGISLISSKQSEFDSVLRKNGVAAVVELMRQV